MIAVDTNVLLRYLLNDDQGQAVIAEKLINGKEIVLITGDEILVLKTDLRSHPVGNYLIFYFPLEDGIDIVRVLNGSRDIE